MAWAVIASVSGGGASEAYPYTKGPIDTTGADIIVVSVACDGAGGTTVIDNKGNSYTRIVTGGVDIHYCVPTTVGSGHTFTVSGGTTFASAASIVAYSGSAAVSPSDQVNHAASASPGSITPTQDGELIISGVDEASSGSPYTCSGFTVATQTPFTAGQWWGCAQAYLVQGTASPVNPTWSGAPRASAIASFKAAAGGGSIILPPYLFDTMAV